MLVLLWKTCRSIHPSILFLVMYVCMSACPALRVTQSAAALHRYLGDKQPPVHT